MTNTEEPTTKGNRIHWMDNLRTIIIFLVVLYHVGGVYEAAGLWACFWIVDDPATIIGWAFSVSFRYFCDADHVLYFRLFDPSVPEKQDWVGISQSEIQEIDDSLDYRCFYVDPALQSHLPVLSRSAARALDHLLSL